MRESAAFAMITVVWRDTDGKRKIHLQTAVDRGAGPTPVLRTSASAGLSFHPTGPLDAGIDGFIELRDPQTGEVRAQYVMRS